MKPSRRRIILYVIGLIAAIVVPVAGGLLVGLLGPPPYLLDEARLGPEWSSPRRFPDGSTVSVTAFSTPAAANQEAASIRQSIPTSSYSQTLDVVRYTRADDGRRGLLLPVGRHIVQVEGADDRSVEQRLRGLSFIRENPEKNLMWVLFTEHLGAVLAGLALYTVALGIGIARGGSWAAEIAPEPGTAPVTEKTLRARILALNDLDLPFRVREEAGVLVAEWRIADARWIGLMEAGGLHDGHRIHMDLDADRRQVRSLDERQTLEWSAGIGQVRARISFFRGISFYDYSRGLQMGLFFKDGRWTTTAYDYRFLLSEMKTPLVQAIAGSGWKFTPVVTLSRPLARLLG